MTLIKKLKQMLSGANSKSETRTEQWESSRTSIKSAEFTVETQEAVFYQGGDSLSNEVHSADQQSNGNVKQQWVNRDSANLR